MAKYTCKKHGGDDRYSWAVFKDGKLVTGGMGQHQARWYRDQMIAADEKNLEDAKQRTIKRMVADVWPASPPDTSQDTTLTAALGVIL